MSFAFPAVRAGLLLALMVTFGLPASASADTTSDLPSVDVIPTESAPSGPNRGQWFVFDAKPGESQQQDVLLRNPADVDQRVELYAGDVSFDGGTPSLDEDGGELSSWARFGSAAVVVPARSELRVPMRVTVPDDAEPGDHVGAVVAESQAVQSDLRVVKRVATRLIITVPGAATREVRLSPIETRLDNALLPGRVNVEITLENTGRIKLSPVVRIAGTRAAGSGELVTQSTEPYRGSVDVPWWGGRVEIAVEVQSEAGEQTRSMSVLVIPWVLIAATLLCLLVLCLAVLRLNQRRRATHAERDEIAAKLRRLQELEGELPAPRSSDEPVRSS